MPPYTSVWPPRELHCSSLRPLALALDRPQPPAQLPVAPQPVRPLALRAAVPGQLAALAPLEGQRSLRRPTQVGARRAPAANAGAQPGPGARKGGAVGSCRTICICSSAPTFSLAPPWLTRRRARAAVSFFSSRGSGISGTDHLIRQAPARPVSGIESTAQPRSAADRGGLPQQERPQDGLRA